VGGASPLPGPRHDRFGAGVFYYGYSEDLKRLLEPVVTLRDEYGAEVFYNDAITPWMRMTANAQAISPAITARTETSPGGTATRISNPTVALPGLRLQIIFRAAGHRRITDRPARDAPLAGACRRSKPPGPAVVGRALASVSDGNSP